MNIDIVWWDLDTPPQTLASLQNQLREEGVDAWTRVPGLARKHWIFDPETKRWGALMLWDGERPANEQLPPNRAQQLIGQPPSLRARFAVAATAERDRALPWLAGLKPHGGAGIDYIVVDAFTRTPLEGNPVAVFLLDQPLPAERMQSIAREMNLSECTFVMPPKQGGDCHVRIFTPVNELPFAGHPLLGTAVALRHLRDQPAFVFETGMGLFRFDAEPEQAGRAFVTMRQPIPSWEPYQHADRLLEALGLASSVLPVTAYRNGPRHVLVVCKDVEALSNVRPDHRALADFEDMSAICLAPAGDHWRCRMFSPAYGVTEDAATGSAAGPIAIHLAQHGLIDWGQPLHILQGVEIQRPSHLFALVKGHARDIQSVEVSGHGVVAAHGRLTL